jgi:hypothetical protein
MEIAEARDSSGRRTHLCTGFGLVHALLSVVYKLSLILGLGVGSGYFGRQVLRSGLRPWRPSGLVGLVSTAT